MLYPTISVRTMVQHLTLPAISILRLKRYNTKVTIDMVYKRLMLLHVVYVVASAKSSCFNYLRVIRSYAPPRHHEDSHVLLDYIACIVNLTTFTIVKIMKREKISPGKTMKVSLARFSYRHASCLA